MSSNRLGIYCRVSSKKQMDNTSLDNQRLKGIDYCIQNGFKYEVFNDVISGSKINRDGLDLLFQKVYDKEISGIILYRWDRLQRQNRDLLTEFEKLVRDTNCKIIVDNVERDIIGSLSDRMEYEISNTFSTVERMRLKLRVGEGIERMMERGNTLFGNCKFGYRNEGKKSSLHTVIDEEKGIIVKEIFRVFNLDSVTNFDLCRQKINEKFNKEYKLKFLIHTLTYDGYKGETTQNWGKINPKTYKVNIPQLINEELWDKTQIKIGVIRSRRKGRDKDYHLLKGKIYCESCNDRLYKYGSIPKDSKYLQSWYRCKWNIKPQYEKNRIEWENGKKCKDYKGNYINRFLLEIVVWDMLLKTLKNSKLIRKKYEDKYKNDLKLKDSNIHSKKYYQKLITKDEDKKFKLYDDYLDKKIKKKDYDLYNVRYDKSIESHLERINDIENKIESFNKLNNKDFEKIEDLMSSDLDIMFDVKNIKDKRKLIDRYIEKIYLKRLDDNNYYLKFELTLKEKMEQIHFNNTYIKNGKIYHNDSYICNFSLNVKLIFNISRIKKDSFNYLFKYNIQKYNFDVC